MALLLLGGELWVLRGGTIPWQSAALGACTLLGWPRPHQGNVFPSVPLLIPPAQQTARLVSVRGSVHAIWKCTFGEVLQGNSALRG